MTHRLRRTSDNWTDSLVVRCDREWKRKCKVFAKQEHGLKLSQWVRMVLSRELKEGKP